MPNPNELHRQSLAEYEDLCDKSHQLGRSKSEREQILRRIRQLERELDIEPAKGYNGAPFASQM